MESDELIGAEISPGTKRKINNMFLDCQSSFLDGIEYLASNREGKDSRFLDDFDETRWDSSGLQLRITVSKTGSLVLDSVASKLKLRSAAKENRDASIRSITVIANLHFYKNFMIPKLLNMLEKKFKIRFHSTDAKNMYDTIDQLDHIVFHNYIRLKAAKMHEITKNAILFSGLEWHTIQKLQDVRPYCYQILLNFVLVHAQVCEVSVSLVRRVIRELMGLLLQDLLICYRRVDGFSLGGMLQVLFFIAYS